MSRHFQKKKNTHSKIIYQSEFTEKGHLPRLLATQGTQGKQLQEAMHTLEWLTAQSIILTEQMGEN